MSNVPIHYEQEDIDKMIDMYSNQKRSITFIANAFHCSTIYIRKVLSENNVPARDSSTRVYKGDSTSKSKLLDAFNKGKTIDDVDDLVSELGCTATHVKTVWREWQAEHGNKEPEKSVQQINLLDKYLTVDKLNTFKETVHIGDTFILYVPNTVACSYSYNNTQRNKKVKVTVLEKYPNFAITDYGAKLWVDLWEASKKDKCTTW